VAGFAVGKSIVKALFGWNPLNYPDDIPDIPSQAMALEHPSLIYDMWKSVTSFPGMPESYSST